MNAESIVMLIVSAGLMVYLLYALLSRRTSEMTSNGWIQIFVFLAVILALHQAARRVHGKRVSAVSALFSIPWFDRSSACFIA